MSMVNREFGSISRNVFNPNLELLTTKVKSDWRAHSPIELNSIRRSSTRVDGNELLFAPFQEQCPRYGLASLFNCPASSEQRFFQATSL